MKIRRCRTDAGRWVSAKMKQLHLVNLSLSQSRQSLSSALTIADVRIQFRQWCDPRLPATEHASIVLRLVHLTSILRAMTPTTTMTYPDNGMSSGDMFEMLIPVIRALPLSDRIVHLVCPKIQLWH